MNKFGHSLYFSLLSVLFYSFRESTTNLQAGLTELNFLILARKKNPLEKSENPVSIILPLIIKCINNVST